MPGNLARKLLLIKAKAKITEKGNLLCRGEDRRSEQVDFNGDGKWPKTHPIIMSIKKLSSGVR